MPEPPPEPATAGLRGGWSWPTQCLLCRQWCTQRLCSDCRQRFAPARWRCARCAVVVPPTATWCGRCLRTPPPYAAAVAAVDYAYPWADAIACFKFAQALDHAAALSTLLVDAVRRAALPPVSLLLPVPLSERRLAERGYNQAWELGRRVARALALAHRATLLRRRFDTPQLATLPRAERATAVRGAFDVEARHAGTLNGQRVALVDDVMTTGATASEAARTLLAAGAAEVQLWVLARTPPPHDD